MAVLLILLTATCLPAFALEPLPEGQEAVDYINKKQSLFTAALPTMSYSSFKSRLMNKKYLEHKKVYAKEININEDIPESFDSRKQWPNCESIKIIRDQANCGSCWAVSAASVMSDRVCVQSKGRIKSMVSDTDILTCCGRSCGLGCDGGYIDEAWIYVKKHGSCTGGSFRQKGVCKPYPFHPCGKHKNQTYYGECPKDNEDTPPCRTICQISCPKKYKEDKIYALSAYDVAENETAIQKEIMKNGPVQAGFTVYTDFFYYSKGIYKCSWGMEEGGHAIKIIGWGTENGVKYWLIANSWNSDWGENGYFRMLRGKNDCDLESMVYAGMMKV